MSLPIGTRVEQVRHLFEGKEAIYVEKGALRVKVSDIRGDVAGLFISAEVEEIPTAGFPAGVFYEAQRLKEVLNYLKDYEAYEPTQRLFAER